MYTISKMLISILCPSISTSINSILVSFRLVHSMSSHASALLLIPSLFSCCGTVGIQAYDCFYPRSYHPLRSGSHGLRLTHALDTIVRTNNTLDSFPSISCYTLAIALCYIAYPYCALQASLTYAVAVLLDSEMFYFL
jgi:hypothetical protein